MNEIAMLVIVVPFALALILVWLARSSLLQWWMRTGSNGPVHCTDAVRRGLEAIRDTIAGRGSEVPKDAERTALDAEINDLLSLLPPQDSGAASLWHGSSTKWETFERASANLAALIRALRARHATATYLTSGPPPMPPLSPDNTHLSTEERGGTPAAEKGTLAADLRDAALLAEISKKFYESWAFKGLSAALLAGVALALGGTFLLAGESYRLSDQLQKRYENGVKEIEKIQIRTETSFAKDTDLLKTTVAAVQTQATQFSRETAEAFVKLKAEQKNFTDQLKADTLDRVVGDLRQAIKDRTGVISDRIRVEEDGLQPKLDALSGRMEKLNASTSGLETGLSQHAAVLAAATGTIHTRMNQFENDVANATAALKANTIDTLVADLRQDITHRTGNISARIKIEEDGLQPQINTLASRIVGLNTSATTLESEVGQARDTMERLGPRLGRLEQNASTVEQAVGRIHIAEAAAALSKAQAEGYAAYALQAQRDAAAARERVDTLVDAVARGLSPQRAALAEIAAAVAILQKSLEVATERVDGVKRDATNLQEVEGQVSTLSRVVARLDERVTAVEALMRPSPTPRRRSVDSLNPAERCAVQRQLNANGFASGKIDGTFGPATYGAIKRWQRSINATENGRLETEQIDRLIGDGPIPPCPTG